MVTSKLWAAQDAIHAALDAADLGEAKYTYGVPTTYERDNVWLEGAVEDWEQEFGVSGLGAKDETFGIQIAVMCQRASAGYLEVRDAVRTLADLVIAAVEADPTLGGVVMLAQAHRYRMGEALLDDRNRAVQLTIVVGCKAWAT